MKTRILHLGLVVLFLTLLLAACGEGPTTPPEEQPTLTPIPPTPTPAPPTLTPEQPMPTPTTAALPTPPPTPRPTRTRVPPPTQPPSPTPWVVQPTPYAPQEALPAGFPPVVYAVQRPEQPAQLWTLRYGGGAAPGGAAARHGPRVPAGHNWLRVPSWVCKGGKSGLLPGWPLRRAPAGV